VAAGCAADVSVRRLGVLSGASVGTACWRLGAPRVLVGLWPAVTHLVHPPVPPLSSFWLPQLLSLLLQRAERTSMVRERRHH
jgi:hypothetical protein